MIEFTVNGSPVPKQRPRISGRMAYTPKKTKDYEERVLRAFLSSYNEQMPAYGEEIPVRACIEVVLGIPKSFSKTKRSQAISGELVPINRKGDVDNFAKSVLDALNGYAYADDCQVTTLLIWKRYGEDPHVAVKICEDI